MQRSGVELIIISDPSNMAWLTGYDAWSFYVHQCVVLRLEGEPVWFGRGMDAESAYRRCFMHPDNIISYPDYFVQNPNYHPMELLGEIIGNRKWGELRIGVEMDNYWFSAAAFQALQSKLKKNDFADVTGLVNWQRAVKSEQELTYLRQAGKIVSRMHHRIREKAEPGIRKCDLVAEIYDASLRFDSNDGFGGDYPAIVPLLPSGSESAASHLTWDDNPMQNNAGTFFEIAGASHRYQCPLSRSLFFGKPPQKIIDAEKAVLEGTIAGLEQATAGKTCNDIAHAFFNTLEKYGISKNSRAGYSIGLSYPPDWGERTMSIRLGDMSVLEENMVFHFMSGLWQDDWGLELTESIIITNDQPELLANVPREILIK